MARAIVTCPKCGTRYRVPVANTPSSDATYRCTRCEHVFSKLESDEAEAAEDLDFHIDEDPIDNDVLADDVAPPAFLRDEGYTTSQEIELPPEPAFAAPEPEEEPEETGMSTTRTSPWLRIGVRFEVFMLIVFAATGLFLSAKPDRALSLVPPILRAGSSDGLNRHSVQQLHLTDLRGGRTELRGGRPAFVITGEVINDSSRATGAVQIEGRLYGETGEISRRTVFAGTKASRRLVKSWTPTEIAMFQKIKPPKTYKLKPGASDNFLIIFQEVPETMHEFACRVVAAQPTRRD
jgi:predicted Zn finger-like uncharacterized protein